MIAAAPDQYKSVHPSVLIDGAEHQRVSYGQEEHWSRRELVPREQCWDCGQPLGAVHWLSCDQERCPSCGGQLLSCDCGAELPEGVE